MKKTRQLLTKHDPSLIEAFEDICKREGRTKKGYIEYLIFQELRRKNVKILNRK